MTLRPIFGGNHFTRRSSDGPNSSIYSLFTGPSSRSLNCLGLQSSLRCLPLILLSPMPPTRTNLIRIAPKGLLPTAIHPAHPIPRNSNEPNRRAEVQVGHQSFRDLSPHSHSLYPHIMGQTAPSSLPQAIRLDGNKRTCRLEPPGNSPNASTRFKHLPPHRDLDLAGRFSYSRLGGDELQLSEDELLVLLLQNRKRRMEHRRQMALEADGSPEDNMIAEITGVETHTANTDKRSSSRRDRSLFGFSSSSNGTLQLGEDCKVCWDRAWDHCFVPCGHVFCGMCAGKMDHCPVCRTKVDATQRLFKP
jgi:hypothetical protein